jgi:hypothetical protein
MIRPWKIWPVIFIRVSFSQERMQYLDQDGKVVYTLKDGRTNKSFLALEGRHVLAHPEQGRADGESTDSETIFQKSDRYGLHLYMMNGKSANILRQNHLDTQNPSSYTADTKKEILIDSINFNSIFYS